MYLDFMEACEKYGMCGDTYESIITTGRKKDPLLALPNCLVTNDLAVMHRMLAVRSRYRRSDWHVGMRFTTSSHRWTWRSMLSLDLKWPLD
jgi:hypothetical protein